MLADPNENLWKSFRNFPGVSVRSAADLCALDVVNGGLVVDESAAMERLTERVGIQAKSGSASDGGTA